MGNRLVLHSVSVDRCPGGGIGRRVGLKHQWGHTRAGSTPALGTSFKALQINYLQGLFFCLFNVVKKLIKSNFFYIQLASVLYNI